MELRYKHFLTRLREEVNSRGHGSKAEIGNNSGCQGAFIGQILKRNATKRASLKLQRAIAEYISGDEDRFFDEGRQILETGCIVAQLPAPTITAQTTTEPPQRRKTDLENHTEKIHHNVIGTFRNKEMALTINQILVEIEKMDGDSGLDKALDQIEALRDRIIKKKGLGSTGTEGK